MVPLLSLLALCAALPTLAEDLSCSDAKNSWACSLLSNSDGEQCCWCGSGVSNGTCGPASQACASGPRACGASSQPSDPCSNASAISSCGQCAAAAAELGCGWCAAADAGSAACGSGKASAPFSFSGSRCSDPANDWYQGSCPPDNQFYGVPLPPWFSYFTASIILVFGTGMTFVGYKMLKIAIIGVGIAASGVPAFLATWSYAPDSGTFSLSTAVLAACVAAAVGGALCWRLFKVGVFIMGASMGVIVALMLQLLVFARFLSAYGNTFLIVAAVLLGLGVGALGLRFMRKTMVVSTSTLGAYAAIRGVSLFVPGSFLAELTLAARIKAGNTLPAAMDGYLAGIAVLALAGVLVQFLVTAKKAGKDDAADELEQELAESELSLDALQGACARRVTPPCSLPLLHCLPNPLFPLLPHATAAPPPCAGTKQKKRKGRRSRKDKAASQKNDALLRDYGGEEAYEEGYDEGVYYDEYGQPVVEEVEMVEAQPEKKRGWGWGSTKKAAAPAPSINSTPTRSKQAQVSW